MATYDLRGLGEDFVIHYGGDEQRIDAFTFANSLMAIGTALQEINKDNNPGFSLEISVVALGGGSFRPRLKAKAKRIGSLLIGDFRSGIVGAFAAILVSRLIGTEAPQIIINEGTVEIHAEGGDVLILPKEAYDALERSKDNSSVQKSIQDAFELLEDDDEVTSFGLARTPDEFDGMPLSVDRSGFGIIARPVEPLAENQREKIEIDTPLRIVRTILEDSNRRWQFVWHGVKISAPILDLDFRKKIIQGDISFTHGDVFIVDLRIIQVRDTSGAWINESYEVVAVKKHLSKGEQTELPGLL